MATSKRETCTVCLHRKIPYDEKTCTYCKDEAWIKEKMKQPAPDNWTHQHPWKTDDNRPITFKCNAFACYLRIKWQEKELNAGFDSLSI